jgi:hypothetical protein
MRAHDAVNARFGCRLDDGDVARLTDNAPEHLRLMPG